VYKWLPPIIHNSGLLNVFFTKPVTRARIGVNVSGRYILSLNNSRLTPVDITPHPRILRMLGEIAFEPHKCIGEFIDNSIDGFLRDPQLFAVNSLMHPQILIIVPHKDVINAGGGEVIVEDNGPGMTLEQLVNAARAGYSASSPIENLGLFGMGFNIAMARLGGITEFRSGIKGESSWSILQIDLASLQNSGRFVIIPRFEHKTPEEHGTRVTIKRLRQELVNQMAAGVRGPTRHSVTGLRQWIGRTYTRFLRDSNLRFSSKKLSILVNGEEVEPYRWCVWGPNRFVEVGASSRLGEPEQLLAYKQFDQVLGGGLYCLSCLSWQPEGIQPGGTCAFCREPNLVERIRKIKGWLGVQRHLHEEEYGIDFLRNGRAILQWDKRIFTWTDPNSGRTELEYPIDEPRARHGRIVGEVEIDHVPVHYQKDSFEEDSRLWKEVIDNLRGTSPLRPQITNRRNMPRNESL
jgi:Histidine kinase-, DNA gyrase B-, and HSP90-like ATPase